MSVASKPVDPDHDVESHKALDIRPREMPSSGFKHLGFQSLLEVNFCTFDAINAVLPVVVIDRHRGRNFHASGLSGASVGLST